MTKVIMNGCNGHMGRVISDLCAKDADIEIVAGIDINTEEAYGYPVFAKIEDCDVAADAIIDFSHVSCVDAMLAYSVEKQIPAVVCTTGLSPEQNEAVKAASEKVAILKSANMSLGINTQVLMLRLWRSITIRSWMRQAVLPLPWRIPSMRLWTMFMSTSMTAARSVRNVRSRRLAFRRFGAATLSVNMKCFSAGQMR